MEQRAHVIRITPLELTMRDVGEGLADFASDLGFTSTPGTFEVLSIEPPANAEYFLRRRATVTRLTNRRR